MKKINSILLVFLIAISTFAGAISIVSAESAAQVTATSVQTTSQNVGTDVVESTETVSSAIDVTEVVSDEVTEEEIEEVVSKIEEIHRYKKVGFTKIWKGHGWIENDDEGYLISGFWLVHGVATLTADSEESTDESSSTSSLRRLSALGRLKIGDKGTYKLVKIRSESETAESVETAESISFHVIPLRAVFTDVASVEEAAIGTLTLTKVNQYDQLTTWNGELTFEDGELEGTWDVDMGTNKKVIRTRAAVAAKIQKQVGQAEPAIESGVAEDISKGNIPPGQIREKNVRPLWKRILFWMG